MDDIVRSRRACGAARRRVHATSPCTSAVRGAPNPCCASPIRIRSGPPKGNLLDDFEHDSGADAQVSEVAQRGAVPVGDPGHPESVTRACLRQRQSPALHVLPPAGGDRISVRIVGGMTEVGVDTLCQPVADRVLQCLSRIGPQQRSEPRGLA